MNDSSSPFPNPNLSPSDKCLLHLLGLKFHMAGDLESGEALDTLLTRWKAINWTDPGFLEFTQKMRAGLPDLTPEQEMATLPSLMAGQHLLLESAVGLLDNSRGLMAANQRDRELARALLDYIKKMIVLHKAMRDKLEILDADIAPYELPKLPEMPK